MSEVAMDVRQANSELVAEPFDLLDLRRRERIAAFRERELQPGEFLAFIASAANVHAAAQKRTIRVKADSPRRRDAALRAAFPCRGYYNRLEFNREQ